MPSAEGISSCQAIEGLLGLGVSKVSINTAAVRNPDLVRQATQKFGSDKITIAITQAHADAVLVASIAHFGKYSIRQMKEYLAGRDVPVSL